MISCCYLQMLEILISIDSIEYRWIMSTINDLSVGPCLLHHALKVWGASVSDE